MATKAKKVALRTEGEFSIRKRATPKVVVGSGREVSAILNRAPARRALAITFDNDNEQSAAVEVYRRIGEFLPQLIRNQSEVKLQEVIKALLPEMTPSHEALQQTRMLVDAKVQILESGDYVRAAEIAKLAGYSENNPSAQPSKWKREGTIFAIEHNGVDYFPLFALNPEKSYKPYEGLSQILAVFNRTKSGWGLAFWFAGLNSFLDDERPQDLLAAAPERVLAAARDEMEGLQHG
jgi:hypothetical protein